MNSIKIRNSLDVCEIEIEGTIGVPEQWQFEQGSERVATYEGFREALKRIEQVEASRVVVNIRSTGGDVNDALLIYEALTSLDAAITTRCYGYVASAATVIAQAASDGERQISPNSLYLIHNSSSAGEGNAEDLESQAALLRKTDERLSELYARRSGGEVTTFAELMGEDGGRGRWLSAEEVISYGLADTLIEGAAATESESEQEPEQEPEGLLKGVINRIASRFTHRLAGGQGEQENAAEQAPQDRFNVAYGRFNSHSTIAFEQGQSETVKSVVKSVEDPLFSQGQLKGNELAYSRDARSISRRV